MHVPYAITGHSGRRSQPGDYFSVEFLRFYFSTREGLQKLGDASPGGAGRNRTLGLKKLENLQVPVPTIDRQHWFDRLQTKAGEARAIRASTAQDVGALISAMLHEIFNGRANLGLKFQVQRLI